MPVYSSVMWKVIMSENEGRPVGNWYDVNTNCVNWDRWKWGGVTWWKEKTGGVYGKGERVV